MCSLIFEVTNCSNLLLLRYRVEQAPAPFLLSEPQT